MNTTFTFFCTSFAVIKFQHNNTFVLGVQPWICSFERCLIFIFFSLWQLQIVTLIGERVSSWNQNVFRIWQHWFCHLDLFSLCSCGYGLLHGTFWNSVHAILLWWRPFSHLSLFHMQPGIITGDEVKYVTWNNISFFNFSYIFYVARRPGQFITKFLKFWFSSQFLYNVKTNFKISYSWIQA